MECRNDPRERRDQRETDNGAGQRERIRGRDAIQQAGVLAADEVQTVSDQLGGKQIATRRLKHGMRPTEEE